MTKKLLSLYGLKWNPFSPELPTEALYVAPKVEHFRPTWPASWLGVNWSLFGGSGAANYCYRNDGGSFVDVTAELGVGDCRRAVLRWRLRTGGGGGAVSGGARGPGARR